MPWARHITGRKEEDKVSVDGVLYDMNTPGHRELMNSRIDKKVKTQHVELKKKETAEKVKQDKLKAEQERLRKEKELRERNSNGRNTKITNANGVEQTGTQMSTLGDFNDMYARVVGKHNMSATAYNPFESVHLHTKGDSRGDMVHEGPSSYSPDEAAAFNSGQGIEWSSDQKADSPYRIPKPADVTSTEGAPQIVKSGAQKVVKGVNGHEFGGDHEAPATMKRDRTSELRRKWMLGDMKDEKGNDLSNIQRLRGMRMEQGFDQQGDKFYAMGSLDPANKDGEKMPTKISKDQYRQAVASDAGAQQVATDLKDAYTAKIKADNNPERSDTQFEPDTSGLSAQVSEAVGMTQAPMSYNADGPKDPRSAKYAQDYLKIKKPFAG